MKTKRFTALMGMVFLFLWTSASGALAFDLEDLLLNLWSVDGNPGVTVGGGLVTTGWVFPLDIAGTQINDAIAGEIANLSLNSSVASFAIEFDPVTGIPLVTTEALGPLFAERAQTLGKKGAIKLGVSASYIDFSEFEGDDLDDLHFLLDHAPVLGDPPPAYASDKLAVTLDIDIDEYVVALYGSYALRDNLDVSLIVPFIDLDMKIDASAQVMIPDGAGGFIPGENIWHSFDPAGINGDLPYDSVSGDAYGVGDIILRLKYFWREFENADVAFAADLKLPTGDEKNLLGADAFTLAPFLILSKTMNNGRFNPHVNFGYEINFDESDFSQLEYAIGFDSRISKQVTIAVDVIGNNELSGDGVGDDLYDINTGVRFNPWRDLIFFGNVQIPINNEGLRADFVPSFGVEYSF